MKIIQINTVFDDADNRVYTFGLGEDNKVYMWDEESAKWSLWQV